MLHQSEQDTVYVLAGLLLVEGELPFKFEQRISHLGTEGGIVSQECVIQIWTVGNC